MPERIIGLSSEVSRLARGSVNEIQRVTSTTKMLALNALIEAARAGEAGRGFAVVAQDVGRVSEEIRTIATQLNERLGQRVKELESLGTSLVANIRGTRLADLALNMIEIIDRNLYERSCDVRWWATDSAVIDCAATPTPKSQAHCSQRLGVILSAYTVYLDIWVCDMQGNVLASGRPGKYPAVKTTNVARAEWFQQAMATQSGDDFTVADVASCPALEGRSVATYAAAIRPADNPRGRPIGVLGIFFDWQSQSQAVVEGVRLTDEERSRTRCLLIDSKHRIIASSDRKGILSDAFPLETRERTMGNYADSNGRVIGFALTPGYETYRGLGWYGVIAQSPPAATTSPVAVAAPAATGSHGSAPVLSPSTSSPVLA